MPSLLAAARPLAVPTGVDPPPATSTGRARSAASPALLAALVVAGLAVVVLAAWSAQQRMAPTGDEPHYLVAARGVAQGTLEQRDLYVEEFRERRYSDDWPVEGTPPQPLRTHNVDGPHGYYSIHNIGLPAWVAGPAALAGVPGARAAMVTVVAAAAALAALAASTQTRDRRRALLVALALVAAAPFLPAAGQVYPDLPAGVLYLLGCLGLLASRARSGPVRWVPYLAAALLPWLQIKLGLLAVVLGSAALLRTARSPGPPGRFLPASALALSLALLTAYNTYAFGDPTGPYESGAALEPGLRAAQTALGLVLDQNQGLLFQHPLLAVAGVAGLALLASVDRLTAAAVGAGAVGIVALNALHPNWYGGTSFSGRFMWTGAVILVLPASLWLARLWQRRPRVARVVLAGSALLQLAFLVEYTLLDGRVLDLYHRREDTLLVAYGLLWHPVDRWLPAFYDPDWVWSHPPNLLWLGALVTALVAWQLALRGHLRTRGRLVVATAAAAALLVGSVTLPPPDGAMSTTYATDRLGSLTGTPVGTTRSAVPGQDEAEFLSFGPGVALPPGRYSAAFRVASTAPTGTEVATADVVGSPDATLLAETPVPGTGGLWTDVEVGFLVPGARVTVVEPRLWWHGTQPLDLASVTVGATS